jgi:hypothetical protein
MLTNVSPPPLTADELARDPRHMGVLAWFDGWGQAGGGKPTTYPRRLTAAEGRDWREGWAARVAEDAAWEARVAAMHHMIATKPMREWT